jgi:hypothetical protein
MELKKFILEEIKKFHKKTLSEVSRKILKEEFVYVDFDKESIIDPEEVDTYKIEGEADYEKGDNSVGYRGGYTNFRIVSVEKPDGTITNNPQEILNMFTKDEIFKINKLIEDKFTSMEYEEGPDPDMAYDKFRDENLEESTDLDKYENVVFLQGDDANEPLRILNDEGEDAALEYLKQWHYPGEHQGVAKLGAGTADNVYEKDGYILTWNDKVGYIGLEYDLNYNESPAENSLQDFIKEEVLKFHKKNLLEYRKNEIENELNVIKEGVSFASETPVIFNTSETHSQEEAIQYFKNELTGIIPVYNVTGGQFGRESIYLLICFQPKEEWPNGILENSNYFRMRIEEDGTMEVFTSSLYLKGVGYGKENRLPIKFRKAKAKSLVDAKDKLMKIINAIKEFYI